jgi:hypothetical protein
MPSQIVLTAQQLAVLKPLTDAHTTAQKAHDASQAALNTARAALEKELWSIANPGKPMTGRILQKPQLTTDGTMLIKP